jgi:hypothetical protein
MRPAWSTPLPRPITIPQVMTLKTLADVRKLISHIPKERRQLSTWQHVEKMLREGEPPDVSVTLQIVLQMERVPFTLGLLG